MKEEVVYQEDQDYLKPRPVVIIHSKEGLNAEAAYAMHLAERFALIAADNDGEDSAGRQKLRLATPKEVVERACKIAELMFVALRDRNWTLPIDSHKTIVERLAKQKEERRKRGDD
jgi:hypothetical protein